MLKTIIELAGVSGSGKTTVTQGLLSIFRNSNALFIDADVNQGFTKRIGAEYPTSLTEVAQKLIQQGVQNTQNTEAIDWLFNDLPVSIDENTDLITVGPLASQLPIEVTEQLKFGLNRFMDGYELVFIDGHHALIHNLLPHEITRSVVVALPGQDVPQQWVNNTTGTPSLIICSSQPDVNIGPTLAEKIENGALKMVGRIPNVDEHTTMTEELLESLKNCIFRLNIPFDLQTLTAPSD